VKHSVETLSPTRVKLSIEVPFTEMDEAFDRAFKRIADQVTIPGFRKGKVPRRVIEQRFGRGAVLEEAINEVIPRAYEDAITQNSITPLGQPEIDVTELEDGQHVTFTAEVDVLPEFDLPAYDSLDVRVDDAEVTDAQVDEQVDSLRARFGTLTVVERASNIGDVLLVNISGADAGAPVEDLSASALSYELGTNGMLPGFDDAVVGASAGDVRTFTFKADAGEFAGKDLEVTVEVTSVRERVLPAADDSFAQLASEFDTIDELREDIRTRLVRVRAFEQGFQARERILERLVDSVDIEVPQSLIDSQIDEHFHDGHGDEAHRDEFVTNTRRNVISTFVLDKIAEKEQIAVSEAELTQWLISESQRYGIAPDEFANRLVEAGNLGMAVGEVRRAKSLSLVLESATVKDASGNLVDLKALNPSTEGATDGVVEADADSDTDSDTEDDNA
jgi:trigger factor